MMSCCGFTVVSFGLCLQFKFGSQITISDSGDDLDLTEDPKHSPEAPHKTENLGRIITIQPIPEVDVDLTLSPTAREVVVSDRWLYNQGTTEAERQAGDAAARQLVQFTMFPCPRAVCPRITHWDPLILIHSLLYRLVSL